MNVSCAGERGAGLANATPLGLRWFGEAWSDRARWVVVAAAVTVYAAAIAPSVGEQGLRAAPLACLPVALAAGLLGLRSGVAVAVMMLPLHALLLHAAGVPGWDALARRTGGAGSLALIVVAACVGWLRDLVRRVQRQSIEIAAQRDALARSAADRVERARLEGVLLAARTYQHELANCLAPTVGYAEVIADHPDLPREVRGFAERALQGARRAVEVSRRMECATTVRETDWGPYHGTTLDLSGPGPGPLDAAPGRLRCRPGARA